MNQNQRLVTADCAVPACALWVARTRTHARTAHLARSRGAQSVELPKFIEAFERAREALDERLAASQKPGAAGASAKDGSDEAHWAMPLVAAPRTRRAAADAATACGGSRGDERCAPSTAAPAALRHQHPRAPCGALGAWKRPPAAWDWKEGRIGSCRCSLDRRSRS